MVWIDDDAASSIVMRNAMLDVGSPRALSLAREFIDNCVEGHKHCITHSVMSEPPLPTRVIDCTNPDCPRLVLTNGRRGKYLTLSYVWGGDQVHKTTTSNISTYECGIDASINILPETIRNAIHVTNRRGFRSLWVDSLCIIQNSEEDKRHELGRMHNIYRFAHLTIIAANAESASAGFLQVRPAPVEMDFGNLRSGGDFTLPFLCPPSPSVATEVTGRRTGSLVNQTPRVGQIHITPFLIAGSAPEPPPTSITTYVYQLVLCAAVRHPAYTSQSQPSPCRSGEPLVADATTTTQTAPSACVSAISGPTQVSNAEHQEVEAFCAIIGGMPSLGRHESFSTGSVPILDSIKRQWPNHARRRLCAAMAAMAAKKSAIAERSKIVKNRRPWSAQFYGTENHSAGALQLLFTSCS